MEKNLSFQLRWTIEDDNIDNFLGFFLCEKSIIRILNGRHVVGTSLTWNMKDEINEEW